MANTSIDYLRLAADSALYTPTVLQTRRFQVFLVQNLWSGSRPGLGTKTQTITPIYNVLAGADGYVRAHQVTTKDITLSQGALKDIQWVIGPIVLPYTAGNISGGYDINTFQAAGTNQDGFIWITGQGLPSTGQYCKKIFDETDTACFYKMYCQNTGIQGL